MGGPAGGPLTHPSASNGGFDAHRIVRPLLVSAGYYLGAQIGFLFQAPDAPQSVLWLPNSILLAVLLVVPYRAWPVYLLAAFPAQMLVAWGTGAPLLTMALLFTTNCADAALGAFLSRRLSGVEGPFRFDGLRSTLIFAAFGAALPTLLLSFADAGISVATGWTSSFQAAFITRARSNILTHLILVPALIDASAADWRKVHIRRIIEGVALTVLVIVTCVAAFGRPATPGTFPALLYAPLPVLLWAAVRFGPGGTGWSVLLVATVASWVALHNVGPFTFRSPFRAVVPLQLFLLASATPLLFLSAVIRERDQASARLRENEGALRISYTRARMLASRLITAQETDARASPATCTTTSTSSWRRCRSRSARCGRRRRRRMRSCATAAGAAGPDGRAHQSGPALFARSSSRHARPRRPVLGAAHALHPDRRSAAPGSEFPGAG